MWYELAQAFALLLVIEGIMPFLAPGRWRKMAAKLAQIDDKSMRVAGCVSMLIGVGLLFVLKNLL